MFGLTRLILDYALPITFIPMAHPISSSTSPRFHLQMFSWPYWLLFLSLIPSIYTSVLYSLQHFLKILILRLYFFTSLSLSTQSHLVPYFLKLATFTNEQVAEPNTYFSVLIVHSFCGEHYWLPL